MSCIGKELAEEASRFPIVDIVDSSDVVTSTAVLQVCLFAWSIDLLLKGGFISFPSSILFFMHNIITLACFSQAFDLVTMKTEQMDFTAIVELEPKNGASLDSTPESKPKATWCYGLVLWFETGFSGRFCKEMPTNLSTSPYQPKTHWSQTILTFREPVAMSSGRSSGCDKSEAVGTDACPAVRMQSRISIARGIQHRKIDISMEVTAFGPDGRKRSWPGQLFNL